MRREERGRGGEREGESEGFQQSACWGRDLSSAFQGAAPPTTHRAAWRTRTFARTKRTHAASLKAMMPAQCTVLRDGRATKVEAHELVPGDIVSIRLGDR